MIEKLSKLKLAFFWALIFLLGIAAGFWGGGHARERKLADLVKEVSRSAAAFGPEELSRLTGTPADASNAAYAAVRDRLVRMQKLNTSALLFSLLRVEPGTGKAVILADTRAAGAGARPGDEFLTAADSAELKRTVETGLPSAAFSSLPGTGAVALAYAPVLETSTGHPPAPASVVLGLEMSEGSLALHAWSGGGQDALALWLALGLPLGAVLLVRHHRQQRSALRNLLEAMEQSHSAVMIVNLDSRIEYVNAGLADQIGYLRREMIGRPWRDFQQPETPPEQLVEMVTTVRAGRSWKGEWFNRRKNGELYTVRGAITPVKNRTGGLAGFVAVFEDMTEAKKSEAVLRAARDRAEAGDRMKSRFLATVSHEVRTPLNGIVGFTSLLLDTPLTAEQREFVQTIRSSGEGMIQLTNDILDFSRIESGGIKLEPQATNPRACLEDALDLLAVPAARKSLEILHWVDDNVPAVVMVDDVRLRQVLVNLIGNAVKFTDAGMVEVIVSAEQTGGGNSPGAEAGEWRLSFTVRDTGIGIAPQHHGLLFKPFSQVDESTTRRYAGTGLGLAISQNLVNLMGGVISVDSAPDRGSAFSFSIPVIALRGVARPASDLGRLRIALAAPAGPFRDEFKRLATRWRVQLLVVEGPADLVSSDWDIAFVALDAARAALMAAEPAGGFPWPAGKTYALVPMCLESDLRTALRRHFCQVLNRPLHHDSVFGLLSGIKPSALLSKGPVRKFGLNVLVVEDNLVNQRLVQKLLLNLGCKASLAGNGRIGLETLANATEAFDLVLMDLHMPEVDGLEAIEKMRAGAAGDHARTLWITVLTADARSDQKEKVVAAGANDYLVKPVNLTELGLALQRFADHRTALGARA